MSPTAKANRDYRTLLSRCLRLRCPACGDGRLFERGLRMRDSCPECGYDLQREPGFYLGSIYVNYGLTAAILVAVCSPLVLWTDIPFAWITPPALLFCVAFPLWFHRYARAVWLGFDYRWDGYANRKAPPRPSANRVNGATGANRTPQATEAGDSSAPAEEDTTPGTVCPFCHHRQLYEQTAGGWVRCANCEQKILVT